jgi:hypothetical protein
MMAGPSSLAPWVNICIAGPIDEQLAEMRLRAVTFDEMTRILYVEVVAFCGRIGKPPPPPWVSRTTERWCKEYAP